MFVPVVFVVFVVFVPVLFVPVVVVFVVGKVLPVSEVLPNELVS